MLQYEWNWRAQLNFPQGLEYDDKGEGNNDNAERVSGLLSFGFRGRLELEGVEQNWDSRRKTIRS